MYLGKQEHGFSVFLRVCYVGSRIVRLFSLPLSLSPSTGDLVSNWAAFVGWPSSIKDGHFIPSLSLARWLTLSFQPHPVSASGRTLLWACCTVLRWRPALVIVCCDR